MTEKNNYRENKLRMGIMCNGLLFKGWQAKCIEQLHNSDLVEIVLLIQKEENNENKTAFLSKLLPLKTLLFRTWCKLFFHAKSIENIDLSETFKATSVVKCKTIFKGKYSEYFAESDIEKINNHHLDFILRFGFNIIRGEVLRSAKYGVWSFHHDDESKYRGGPAGFWEIVNNDCVNGVILQRLTDRLDSGIILRKAFFKTVNHSYTSNVDNLFFGATSMPLQVCIDIINNTANYIYKEGIDSKATIFRAPGNFLMLKFIAILFANKLRFHFNQLFQAEKWNVGIVEISSASLINSQLPENVTWLPSSNADCFIADSFAIEKSKKELEIYFEDYNYSKEKGKINAITYNKNEQEKFSEKVEVLEEAYHLAYPFVITEQDDHFIMPECSGSGRVAIYRRNKISNKFEFFKILIDGIDAVDATLFFFNEKWWLFLTRKKTDTNTCLFAYYADEIFGNYQEHNNNPVKIDVRSSRSAGTPFFINRDLIRPAQESSEIYGKQIYLNKIIKLNEYEFEEETINVLKPNPKWPYNKGIHTICVTENFVVFDAKKYEFIGSAFLKQLKRKIKKL